VGHGEDGREERTDREDHGNMQGRGEGMERVRKMAEYGTRGDRRKTERVRGEGMEGAPA
jgi:hypothetical protein